MRKRANQTFRFLEGDMETVKGSTAVQPQVQETHDDQRKKFTTTVSTDAKRVYAENLSEFVRNQIAKAQDSK